MLSPMARSGDAGPTDDAWAIREGAVRSVELEQVRSLYCATKPMVAMGVLALLERADADWTTARVDARGRLREDGAWTIPDLLARRTPLLRPTFWEVLRLPLGRAEPELAARAEQTAATGGGPVGNSEVLAWYVLAEAADRLDGSGLGWGAPAGTAGRRGPSPVAPPRPRAARPSARSHVHPDRRARRSRGAARLRAHRAEPGADLALPRWLRLARGRGHRGSRRWGAICGAASQRRTCSPTPVGCALPRRASGRHGPGRPCTAAGLDVVFATDGWLRFGCRRRVVRSASSSIHPPARSPPCSDPASSPSHGRRRTWLGRVGGGPGVGRAGLAVSAGEAPS